MDEISTFNPETNERKEFDSIEDALASDMAKQWGTCLVDERFNGHDLSIGDRITVDGHRAEVVFGDVDGTVNVVWFEHDDPDDRSCVDCGVGWDDAPDCPERAGPSPFIPVTQDGEEILYCRDCAPDNILDLSS